MFKFRSKERRIFSSRKRKRRNAFGLWAIASLLLFLLVLELLTRIFVDLSGNRDEFATADMESEMARAYQLNFVGESQINSDADSEGLKAKPSLGGGYELVGDQESQYWQINPQGFRDRDPVPLIKPKDEIRIFLLGGSTAFGYGSPDNTATISEYLEQRLQQRLQQQQNSPQLYKPDVLPSNPEQRKKSLAKPSKIKPGNYRVINAGVPGYASGNELAQLALKILKYKPDLIVVLDGYPDLMLKGERQAVQESFSQTQSNRPNANYISRVIEPLEDKSTLVKLVRGKWFQEDNEPKSDLLNEQTSNLVKYLPSDEAELQQRVDRYLDHHQQILNLSAAAGIPLIVATQPEITGRDPSQLTDAEGKIATELGRTYIQEVRESYPVLIDAVEQLANAFPKNLKAVDLYKLTDKYPSPSFIDPIHLNEAANQKVAEQLYYAISSFPKMQLEPKQAPAAVSPRSR